MLLILLQETQTIFGIILERKLADHYIQEYMNGFKDIVTGEARRGYVDVVQELKSRFADVDVCIQRFLPAVWLEEPVD